jgi:hypothetical protein
LKSLWPIALFGAALWGVLPVISAESGKFSLATNDVVAFVGGSDVAAAQYSGHLEALLAIHYRGMGIRFRNFGWEGDTVFERPRDIGFPSLLSNLQKAGVTVVVVQFGRAEALDGKKSVTEFRRAYARLLDELTPNFRKLVLVTPAPFENGGGLLPDLSKRNPALAEHAQVIRELARQRQLTLVDLFEPIFRHPAIRHTSDGLQFTLSGQEGIALLFFQHVEGHELTRNRSLSPEFEAVRQAVIAKNRLWFDYSRPQNWAFLGGDRTSQPSSRDHRDPKVRWFPNEMEKFLPLIAEAEKRIEEAAAR